MKMRVKLLRWCLIKCVWGRKTSLGGESGVLIKRPFVSVMEVGYEQWMEEGKKIRYLCIETSFFRHVCTRETKRGMRMSFADGLTKSGMDDTLRKATKSINRCQPNRWEARNAAGLNLLERKVHIMPWVDSLVLNGLDESTSIWSKPKDRQ